MQHRLSFQFNMMHSQLEMPIPQTEGNLRLSVPTTKNSRLKRALSSGRLDEEESKRKALSFQAENELMLVDEEVMSDDDKNKIELIEGEMDIQYEPTPIKNLAIQNLSPETSEAANENPDKEETMLESFVIPESEGFSLDFI